MAEQGAARRKKRSRKERAEQSRINTEADAEFHRRHPELGGRRLTARDDQALKDEWMAIRSEQAAAKSSAAPGKPVGAGKLPCGRSKSDVPPFKRDPRKPCAIEKVTVSCGHEAPTPRKVIVNGLKAPRVKS